MLCGLISFCTGILYGLIVSSWQTTELPCRCSYLPPSMPNVLRWMLTALSASLNSWRQEHSEVCPTWP